jgi:transposase-like protein
VGSRWWCDETYVRVHGRWAYRYRAIDEQGQVVDVLLREHRDLASAEAFFAQAIQRCGDPATVVITDKHQAYVRAVSQHAPGASHVRTGVHRARGETTRAIERSHLPIKDRLRPMRGLQSVATGQQSVATGQRLLDGIDAVQDLRRVEAIVAAGRRRPHERARAVVRRFEALAYALRRGH